MPRFSSVGEGTAGAFDGSRATLSPVSNRAIPLQRISQGTALRLLSGVAMGVLVLASCGDSKTFSLQSVDSNQNSVTPTFVVVLTVDASGTISQNQPTVRGANNQIYYYSGESLEAFENCAVATNQVDREATIHGANPSLADCRAFASSLGTLNIVPSLTDADLVEGSAVTLPASGYVYVLFVHSPTFGAAGADADPSVTITPGNRCVKLWAAKIDGKRLLRVGAVEATTSVDLNELYCFGIPQPA